MNLLDMHSHKPENRYESIYQFDRNYSANKKGWFSIGIHPKDVEQSFSDFNQLIESLAHTPEFIAIGEIGLDSRLAIDSIIQQQTYILQLKIARQFSKPIILHCVNQWDLCRKLHSVYAPEQTIIYHGFSKPTIIDKVLSYPPARISLGERLLHSSSLQSCIQNVPLNRIFLETDDADVDLMELYEKLAEIKSLPLPAVTEQLYQNFLEVFHHGKLA